MKSKLQVTMLVVATIVLVAWADDTMVCHDIVTVNCHLATSNLAACDPGDAYSIFGTASTAGGLSQDQCVANTDSGANSCVKGAAFLCNYTFTVYDCNLPPASTPVSKPVNDWTTDGDCRDEQ